VCVVSNRNQPSGVKYFYVRGEFMTRGVNSCNLNLSSSHLSALAQSLSGERRVAQHCLKGGAGLLKSSIIVDSRFMGVSLFLSLSFFLALSPF